MTFRALTLGLAGALFVALVNFPSGTWGGTSWGGMWITSAQLPRFVFGVIVLMGLVLNPLIGLVRREWRLRAGELAVVFIMMLVATHAAGLHLPNLYNAIGLPAQIERTNPGYQKTGALDYAPPAMLVAGGEYDEKAVGGFMNGLGRQQGYIDLSAIPWQEWETPFWVWGVILGLAAAAVMSLSLVVHRQWSQRERLRYPIAEFATALMEQDRGSLIGPVFRSRAFWIGFALIFGLRTINQLHAWFPQVVFIKTEFYLAPIMQKYPGFARVALARDLVYLKFIPSMIAFSFFLAADVSFSLGLSAPFTVLVMGTLQSHGVTKLWEPIGFVLAENLGAYLGIALMIGYIGRRYYWQVLRSALGLGARDDVERYATWAARVLIASVLGLTGFLMFLGLDWVIATMCVGCVMLLYLGFARMTAEAGVFRASVKTIPTTLLFGLFGSMALGPEALAITGLVSMGLSIACSEYLMPMVVNGLRVGQNTGVKPARAVGGISMAYVVALVVGTVMFLWVMYSFGMPHHDWYTRRVPQRSFDPVKTMVDDLTLTDELDVAKALGPLERFVHMHPDPVFTWSLLFGLGGVLLVSALRLRYTWWPIHPIMFMVMGSWAVRPFYASYLLGCAIKVAVTRFGGSKAYYRVMPLMIGVLAGDMLAATLYTVIAWIYHLVTGQIPRGYPGL